MATPSHLWQYGFNTSWFASQALTSAVHCDTLLGGNAASSFCSAACCWCFCITASFILASNVLSSTTQLVSLSKLSMMQDDLLKLMVFFWFQSLKKSSNVSLQGPGPIFLVLDATGLIFAHPCSGALPSVCPTPRYEVKQVIQPTSILVGRQMELWHSEVDMSSFMVKPKSQWKCFYPFPQLFASLTCNIIWCNDMQEW